MGYMVLKIDMSGNVVDKVEGEVLKTDEERWLSILQKERKLLIDKTKTEIIASTVAIIPASIFLLGLVINREPIFPILGAIVQSVASLALLAIVVLCPSILIVMNFIRYLELEKIANEIIAEIIKKESDFLDRYRKQTIPRSKPENRSQGEVEKKD